MIIILDQKIGTTGETVAENSPTMVDEPAYYVVSGLYIKILFLTENIVEKYSFVRKVTKAGIIAFDSAFSFYDSLVGDEVGNENGLADYIVAHKDRLP